MSKAKKMKISTENDANAEENVCLACTNLGKYENVFNLTFEDLPFSDIFTSCVGFELPEDSKLKYMCFECINTIIAFHTFKEKAIKCYEELHQKETEIEISISTEDESQGSVSENIEQILVFSIDDDNNINLIESSEAKSNSTTELDSDVKIEILEGDDSYNKSDKESRHSTTIDKEKDDVPLKEDDSKCDLVKLPETENLSIEYKGLSKKELNEKNLWKCTYCSMIISKNNPAEIKRHRKNVTSDHCYCQGQQKNTNVSEDDAGKLIQYAEKVKRIRIYECPVCHKKYTKSVINEHIARHGEEKPVTCDICGKGVSSNQALKHHMMLHDGKKFACEICNKGFTQQFLLKEHLSVHEKDKTFLCPTCGMSFPSATRVRQHQYKHKNKKSALSQSTDSDEVMRHICDVCGKSFSSTKTLEVHRAKHESDETFECFKCGKKFGHRALLTSHIWLHMAEYRCQKCFKIYQKDDLRNHDCKPLPKGETFNDFLPNECRQCGEILQHGNIDRHLTRHDVKECKICGQKIFGTRKLQFHMNIHKLVCDMCGKGFAKKENYIRHVNNQVNKELEEFKLKEENPGLNVEKSIFEKANTKPQYLGYIAKLVLEIRHMVCIQDAWLENRVKEILSKPPPKLRKVLPASELAKYNLAMMKLRSKIEEEMNKNRTKSV